MRNFGAARMVALLGFDPGSSGYEPGAACLIKRHCYSVIVLDMSFLCCGGLFRSCLNQGAPV